MAYTYDQLVKAYKAVHDGIAPDAATQATFQVQATLSANGQISDAQLLSNIINSADNSTALAVLSYQFFTGKTPTAAGMDYLLNSAANTNDLNDAYYSKFSLENRYINFAANLGVQGEGAASFASKYGAMSFADYVASIYQTIIGGSYAQAAGIDPTAAIASIISRKDAILATAQSAGMIPANATAAQIDLALKAATAGYLMGEAIKADVGLYAAAANNFMAALAQGNAVYNTNLTYTYAPSVSSFSHGTGKAVDAAPTTLPSTPTTTTPTTPSAAPAIVLGTGANNLTGTSGNDTFTATGTTIHSGDVLDGGGGNDTLTVNATGSLNVLGVTVSSIETANFNSTSGVLANTASWTGLTTLNVNANGGSNTGITPASTTDLNVKVTNQGASYLAVNNGHNITVTATGVTGSGGGNTGRIDVSSNSNGAINVTRTSTNIGATAPISVSGGGTIKITEIAGNANGTTQVNGVIYASGNASTTSVEILTPQQATVTGTTRGITANQVFIGDYNTGNTSALGSITTVKVDGYSYLSISDNALTTLSLAHGYGDVDIDSAGAHVAGHPTTLSVTLKGVAYGALGDQNDSYTTINLITDTESSVLNDIGSASVTTLNVSGNANLNLLSVIDLTALQTVTVTGSGGLTADFSGLTTVTTVDAHAATGGNVFTFDGGTTTVTAGSGGDFLYLVGGVQDITLGAGVDIVRLSGINTSSSTDFATIHSIHAGDKLNFSAITSATTVGAQITGLPGGSTFTDYLNAAANSSTAAATNEIHWFEFGGSTYIVLDNSNDTNFHNGSDLVVKLAGVTGLHITNADVSSGALTF